MPPAKKTTSAAKRSRVAGRAEDEVLTDPPRPAEAHDPNISSDAKRELFADEPRPEGDSSGNVTPVETSVEPTDDGAQTELSVEDPPERHESGSYEQDHAEKTEEDADFEAEEKDPGA